MNPSDFTTINVDHSFDEKDEQTSATSSTTIRTTSLTETAMVLANNTNFKKPYPPNDDKEEKVAIDEQPETDTLESIGITDSEPLKRDCPVYNNLKDNLNINLKGLLFIRDALSFYLTNVRLRYNKYNIFIIVLSMSTAFFETVKVEMSLDSKPPPLNRIALLLPIGMSTLIAFASSMMKFARLAEAIEDVTKSMEKCHYGINRHREILQNIIIKDKPPSKDNVKEIYLCFREAILSAEIVWLSRMDASTKNYYLIKSSAIHSDFLTDKKHAENVKEMLAILKDSFHPSEDKSWYFWICFHICNIF